MNPKRQSGRPWPRYVLFALLFAAAAWAGASGWSRFFDYRRVRRDARPIPRPPEAVAHAREMGYPWAEGLTRQERTKAFEQYGRRIWESSSIDDKMDVARGFYPDLSRRLGLRPDQNPQVRAIYDQTIAGLLPVWDGFWQPNFGRGQAVLQTVLILGQARQSLEPILDADQKARLDRILERPQRQDPRPSERRD